MKLFVLSDGYSELVIIHPLSIISSSIKNEVDEGPHDSPALKKVLIVRFRPPASTAISPKTPMSWSFSDESTAEAITSSTNCFVYPDEFMHLEDTEKQLEYTRIFVEMNLVKAQLAMQSSGGWATREHLRLSQAELLTQLEIQQKDYARDQLEQIQRLEAFGKVLAGQQIKLEQLFRHSQPGIEFITTQLQAVIERCKLPHAAFLKDMDQGSDREQAALEMVRQHVREMNELMLRQEAALTREVALQRMHQGSYHEQAVQEVIRQQERELNELLQRQEAEWAREFNEELAMMVQARSIMFDYVNRN